MRKKIIAWGYSKLLQICFPNPDKIFEFCIDTRAAEIKNPILDIMTPEKFFREKDFHNYMIVIFAVSNTALRDISYILEKHSIKYKHGYIFFSDYLYQDYKNLVSTFMSFNESIYTYALNISLNLRKKIFTTILGTDLFLQCMQNVAHIEGDIAEVGVYEGGNAYTALSVKPFINADKNYYLIDSFEGFPELSSKDPVTSKKGDLHIEIPFEELAADFSRFPNCKIFRGFVPNILQTVPQKNYSLVFYDCDLYQPAIDTFTFFWEKLTPGGILLVHDYFTEPNGFTGVHDAVHEFFSEDVTIHKIPYTTMCLIQK